jgi:tetratricopeptide (TPR) repeat protein
MHGLINLYAEELLRPEEMAAARERLFRYFVFAAQQADSSVVPQRYHMGLSGDAPVTPPMGDYARALDWFDTECAAIVAMCRQDLPELDPLRWRLAFHLRGYLFLTKRTHEWVASHEAALAAAMRSGDRLGEAIIRNSLGVALLERGFDDEAMRQYETAQRLFADEGDGHGLSNALANQAVVFRQRGDFATSLRLSADALEFYRRVGAGRNVAITLRGMALSEIQLGRIAEAHKHVTESIELCAELGMDMDVAMSLNTLGEVLMLAQRYDEGERAYQGAIEMSRRCSSRYEEARALRGLGVIAVAVGQATAAQTYWQEALAILESLGSAEADDVRVDLDRLATPP